MAVELRPFGVACNIACHYCYQQPQRDAGNHRQAYDLDRMLAVAAEETEPFTLFGGEPLLMPIEDLERVLRWGFEHRGGSGIQTNGTLISDEHMRLFREFNVDVGVSIDGPGELNDLRWQVDLERTRRATDATLRNIERLCREHRSPGLIITLHRVNASADRLPRLLAWVRELDALGIRSAGLHLLEVESEWIRRRYALTEEENVEALLRLSDLQAELKGLRFDVMDEMERALLGRDRHNSCVWRSCDPYRTQAVRGIEGNGQRSNCGRTNKDGIDFLKTEHHGYERGLALARTPQEHGGCRGCRFFLMCRGQCPGTALDGDWRNRSEHCGVWKRLFERLEAKLLEEGRAPLSLSPNREGLERRLIAQWARRADARIETLVRFSDELRVAEPDAPIPPFVRIAFAGETQRRRWGPRIAAARHAAVRLNLLAAAGGRTAVALIHVERTEAVEVHHTAAALGLRCRILPGGRRGTLLPMVVGARAAVAAYERAQREGDRPRLDELLGVPACCRRAEETRRPAFAERGDARVVACPPGLNTLFRPLGIDLLGYDPCGPDCHVSAEIAAFKLDLGRNEGGDDALDALEAVLALPVQWTALHGIAELKTPVFRLIHDTEPTAERVMIRLRGEAFPADGARGLAFPFREPRSPARTPAVRAWPYTAPAD